MIFIVPVRDISSKLVCHDQVFFLSFYIGNYRATFYRNQFAIAIPLQGKKWFLCFFLVLAQLNSLFYKSQIKKYFRKKNWMVIHA